jgi:hypothetical protein
MALFPLGILSAAGASVGGDYEHIATVLGTGSANTITFSSIPQNYKHLQVRFSAKNTITSSERIQMTMNGITTASYTRGRYFAAGTGSPTGETLGGLTGINLDDALSISTGAGIVAGGFLDIADYTNSTRNKAVKGFYGQQGNKTRIYIVGGFLLDTPPITSITFTTAGAITNLFATTTRFSLYGIR